MALGGDADEVDGVAVVRAVEHVEGLAEAEVAQDVHGEPVAPVRHVLGGAPALGFVDDAAVVAETLAEGADVGQDVALDLLDGAVGEGVRQDAALAGVQVLVAGVVGVRGRVHKGVVELGLAHVGAEAVDVLEGRVGVDRQRAGPEAHKLAVPLVQAPELEVAVTAPGVVEHVGIRELGQERARVLGQRVEEEAVDDEACCVEEGRDGQ